MAFPQTRLRRLRRTSPLRDLVRETRLDAGDLVLPLFVESGLSGRKPIGAMPGVDRLGIEEAVREAGEARALGLGGVLLFGIPESKDAEGSGAWDEEGIVQLATRAIKDAHPDLLVMTDLCLCEYTSHGHCGVLRDSDPHPPAVDNDASVELLARAAVAQARAVLQDAPWTAEGIEEALKLVVEASGRKPKQLYQPLRVALVGTTVSPGIFETLEVLGRDEALARLAAATA